MADISKINLDGTVYDIKDSVARDAIVNTLKFKGITTVALTNEGTQVPTDIYGTKATTADIRVGDLIVYDKAEYVWIEKKSGETSTKQCWRSHPHCYCSVIHIRLTYERRRNTASFYFK